MGEGASKPLLKIPINKSFFNPKELNDNPSVFVTSYFFKFFIFYYTSVLYLLSFGAESIIFCKSSDKSIYYIKKFILGIVFGICDIIFFINLMIFYKILFK